MATQTTARAEALIRHRHSADLLDDPIVALVEVDEDISAHTAGRIPGAGGDQLEGGAP